MSEPSRSRLAWGILWRSSNRLFGDDSHLIGVPGHPCRTRLFETRAEARLYIKKEYAYIADRPDLRREPHGWEMPIAVRVRITVAIA